MHLDADRPPPVPLPVVLRRHARRLAYWNAAVWAIGNGLASTTLVVYLAMDLGAEERIGLGIGLILAVRHVVGLLRLGAPAMIDRLVDRKRFCLGAFLLSVLTLLGLPWIAAPGRLPSAAASLTALVALWCVYHLLQYVATIALWSWLADLVPLRVRGRFLGRRQRWLVAGEVAGTLSAAAFVWGWQAMHPAGRHWMAYAIAAAVGGLFFLAALVPLALMPGASKGRAARRGATLRDLVRPFRDRRFLRLLAFGCWFSLSNGLTQSAQNAYLKLLLGSVALVVLLAASTGMSLGQLALSPWLGRLADRLGNRPVMFGSLLLVAQGPLCYCLSTPEQPWWFVAAWALWIAYAGLNVCLPNLLLKLSPAESNGPHIATYFAVTGLCYAVNTIVGGAMHDRYFGHYWMLPGGITLDYYRAVFLLGWAARSLGLLVLLLVIEPPGRRAGGR